MKLPEDARIHLATITAGRVAVLRWALVAASMTVTVYLMMISPNRIPYMGHLWRVCSEYGLPTWTPAKAAHFLSFLMWAVLMLGALSAGYFRRLPKWLWHPFGALAGIYVITPELLQMLNPARHPSLRDAFINISGVLVGVITHLAISKP